MSLKNDGLRAFAAGVAVCAAGYVCIAVALPGITRATIDNFTFKPDTLTVRLGTTLAWVNEDDIPHSIVETEGKFHSAALDTGDTFSFIFDKVGTFEYFCGLHPFMKGKIVVAPP
jgi:plastocyanin